MAHTEFIRSREGPAFLQCVCVCFPKCGGSLGLATWAEPGKLCWELTVGIFKRERVVMGGGVVKVVIL